ncbi:hypothetical protein QPK32_24965 [Massilia sp. YIM B02763]|uniref:hypothetical protein n=1 Tax=Massilia sp. YIM B02763 TaxID=3050130 RepID=UPI0025B63002|nr:hypothetical protein [Massilia sp. YIM B02763]MDN4056322.1 hypothetical protein [Massilia sp. YIM B02763]
MPDQVTPLYDDGRPLPLHRLAMKKDYHEGAFMLDEVAVQAFKRTVPVARLVGAGGADVLPPLYEARFLWMKGGIARVTGIAVDELSHRRTVQTWNVRFEGWTPGMDAPPL